MLWPPEGARLRLMQLPKDESEQAAEGQSRSKKNPRFRQANQGHQDYAESDEKADRMTGKTSSTILSKWNDILRMQFVGARGGGSNKCLCILTESSHGEYP